MDLPHRKPQRLKGYDYSQNNAYFITICTQNRLHLLGGIVNETVELSDAGKMAEERFLNIAKDTEVNIEKYVFMPNHIHAIVLIDHNGTTQGSFPTVSASTRSASSESTSSDSTSGTDEPSPTTAGVSGSSASPS